MDASSESKEQSVTIPTLRVSAFIDGFNLYHAIDSIGRNELKWLNLRKLLECFTEPGVHELHDVFYFSAYAEWLQEPRKRHMAYVRALKHFRVTAVMGDFKAREMSCNACDHNWTYHEEKQSDVNLAVQLVREAYKDTYDRAYVVSGDSDLAAPLRLLKEIFPQKKVKVICPPRRMHSKELCQLAHKRAKIEIEHLEKCLMPETLATATGLVTRPASYAPPGIR